MRFLFLALFGAFAFACGPSSLQVSPTGSATTLQVGAQSQEIRSFTDLDEVRGIAVSDQQVVLATDRGVVSHPRGGVDTEPVRILAGLPSPDVRAVAIFEGGVVAATDRGIVRIADGAVAAFGGEAPIGTPTAMHRTQDGELYAGGTRGLAVYREGRWLRFGEEAAVTTFAETSEGALWVGTTGGAWFVEGDVIQEHPVNGGIPEPYVRSIVAMPDGAAMFLLQGPNDSRIGYFDGRRWWGYTLRDFPTDVIALARLGGAISLVTPGRSFEILQAEGGGFSFSRDGVPLLGTSRGELRTARIYRARLAAPVDIEAPEGDEPEVERAPTRLYSVAENEPTQEAPAFLVTSSERPTPLAPTLVRSVGPDVYIADRNRGVVRFDATGARTFYRTNTLVPEDDFQVAIDVSSDTWVLGADGTVARYTGEAFERQPAPDGVTAQAIASGPGGVFVTTLGAEGSSQVRVYRVDESGWSPVVERTLPLPEGTALLGLPHLAVTNDQALWSTVRVRDEYGERIRGVVVLSAAMESVVFHRRGADAAVDGEGARSMPDEVSGIDASQEGYVWLPSLNGAVRIGDSQAIVFGEARGVRGEVVSDVAVGDGRVWLAAAEGVGYYESREFEFRLPAVVQQSRPTALATDSLGNLWGAGRNGVVYYDGETWLALNEENGLPTNELVDVEVDAEDRVWLLATDRLLLVNR